MSDERKHIDNYFSEALESREEEQLDVAQHWEGIEAGLGKTGFFVFRFNRFNVYYLAVCCVALILLILFFVKNEKQVTTKLPTSTIQPKTAADKFTVSDLPLGSSETSENTVSLVTTPYEEKRKPAIKKDVLSLPAEQAPVDSITKESAAKVETPSVSLLEEQKKIDSLINKKIKPPVVISRRRDTIHQVDTVFTNKRKKNRQ